MIFVDVFLKLKSSLNFFQVVVWWGWRLWNPSVAERKTDCRGQGWNDMTLRLCFLSQGLLYASLEYSLKSGIPAEFISTENILYPMHRTIDKWYFKTLTSFILFLKIIWLLQWWLFREFEQSRILPTDNQESIFDCGRERSKKTRSVIDWGTLSPSDLFSYDFSGDN